jgi:DNA-binding response OmpR family regulator
VAADGSHPLSSFEFLERTGAPYLTKPCDLNEVRRTVRRVLRQEPSAGQRSS